MLTKKQREILEEANRTCSWFDHSTMRKPGSIEGFYDLLASY